MLNAFRRLLFWSHLICGVTAGIVILIMCVTGVALTYQKEMQWWTDTRHYWALPPAGVPRAGVDQILDAVRAFDATASPTTVAWRAQADAPVAAAAGTRALYVNPYTAAVYGEGTGPRVPRHGRGAASACGGPCGRSGSRPRHLGSTLRFHVNQAASIVWSIARWPTGTAGQW